MSSLQRRIAAVCDMTANHIALLREVDELRDLIRKAQLSARRSRKRGRLSWPASCSSHSPAGRRRRASRRPCR
jgi:hypothetical protein